MAGKRKYTANQPLSVGRVLSAIEAVGKTYRAWNANDTDEAWRAFRQALVNLTKQGSQLEQCQFFGEIEE